MTKYSDVVTQSSIWLERSGRAFDKISNTMLALAMVSILAIWLMMISEVAVRTFFGISLLVTWEFSAYLLGWSTFLAAPAAARNMVHIRVSVVTEYLPTAAKQIVVVTAYGIACAVGAFCCWAISKHAWDAFERDVVTQTLAQLPQWILYAVPALGTGVFALASLLSAFETLMGGTANEHGEDE